MEKYHIYVIIAFFLGICIKLYDDYTDFEDLNIPPFYIDILKMLIYILNTVLTLYDYRFSFIPIFAVLASYMADKLKKTKFTITMTDILKKNLNSLKKSTIFNKAITDIINNKLDITSYTNKSVGINDHFWDIYMICSMICIIMAFILNPSQLSLKLITSSNMIAVIICLIFNVTEPFLFPEDYGDAKILSRIFCVLIIILMISFGHKIVNMGDINYIISYSVLAYLSMSVISMYIYEYKCNNDKFDKNFKNTVNDIEQCQQK